MVVRYRVWKRPLSTSSCSSVRMPLREIVQELVPVGGEQCLEIFDAGEGALVGQLATRVHFWAELEADADARVYAAARRGIAFADAAVAVTLAADHVE
jgi:hypothetical protein